MRLDARREVVTIGGSEFGRDGRDGVRESKKERVWERVILGEKKSRRSE